MDIQIFDQINNDISTSLHMHARTYLCRCMRTYFFQSLSQICLLLYNFMNTQLLLQIHSTYGCTYVCSMYKWALYVVNTYSFP